MADEFDFEQFKPTSDKPTSNQRTLYFISALFTVSIPCYLYYSLLDLSPKEYAPIFGVVSLLSAYIVTLAYHNSNLWLKNKLSALRDGQITVKSVTAEALQKGKKPNVFAKEKREALEAETEKEALYFSLFYNNATFLLAALLCFYLFRNTTPAFNYVLSTSLSAALLSVASAS